MAQRLDRRSLGGADQVDADVTPMMIFEEFLAGDAGRAAVACRCNMLRSVAT
jgi:hypothetical protein